MAKGHVWTEEEIEMLKDRSIMHKDIAEKTGKSISSVSKKRIELGIRQRVSSRTKGISQEPKGDKPERIQQCLHCQRPYCNNCYGK